MKTILISAALVIGTAAAAQQTTTDQTGAEQQQAEQAENRPTVSEAEAPEELTQEGTNPEGEAVAPPGANVVATPPPGAGVVVAPNQQAVFSTRQPAREYPRCTREITDNCVQGGPRN